MTNLNILRAARSVLLMCSRVLAGMIRHPAVGVAATAMVAVAVLHLAGSDPREIVALATVTTAHLVIDRRMVR